MDIICITFDWGDTLAANNGMPYLELHRRAIRRFGQELELHGAVPQDWYDRAVGELEVIWHDTIDPLKNPEWREADLDAAIRGWVAYAGIADNEALRAARTRMEQAWTDVVRPYGGAAETLSRLKAMGYRIGILSHVAWPPEACRAWYRRWGMAESIDFYSLSSEVGWIKPNPAHYDHAIRLAGVPAGRILHVGDHPTRDVIGAREHGMRTCLRLTQGIYDPAELACCKPDLQVGFVDELPDLLDAHNQTAG
ncbi:MAG: HAD family hydrolase [Planctomycetota bacterium]